MAETDLARAIEDLADALRANTEQQTKAPAIALVPANVDADGARNIVEQIRRAWRGSLDDERPAVAPPSTEARGSVPIDTLSLIAVQAVDKVLNANGHRGQVTGLVRLKVAHVVLQALGLDRHARTEMPDWSTIDLQAGEISPETRQKENPDAGA